MEVVLSHSYNIVTAKEQLHGCCLHYKGINEKGFHAGKPGLILVPLSLQRGCYQGYEL